MKPPPTTTRRSAGRQVVAQGDRVVERAQDLDAGQCGRSGQLAGARAGRRTTASPPTTLPSARGDGVAGGVEVHSRDTEPPVDVQGVVVGVEQGEVRLVAVPCQKPWTAVAGRTGRAARHRPRRSGVVAA
jgi:hypothetical protein